MDPVLLVRSWRPFLDYRYVALPHSFGDLKDRLVNNPKYYAANYAFVGGFLCLIECLLYRPFIIFLTSMGLLLTIWFSFSHLPLYIGDTLITPVHKSVGMTLLGVLSLYLTESTWPLLYVSLCWIVIVFLHAAFRMRSSVGGGSSSAIITKPAGSGSSASLTNNASPLSKAGSLSSSLRATGASPVKKQE